mgnify:CR=1 FL=1
MRFPVMGWIYIVLYLNSASILLNYLMKKYLVFVIINLLALTIGLIVFDAYKSIEVLGAIIATGISLSLGLQQSKIQNDIIFKELFIEFNHTYNTKFNDTLEVIVIECQENNSRELNPAERQIVIDYLNLCAEEYLWKTLHRIPNKVWNSWEKGIVFYLNQPIINKVVISEKLQRGSYYGLFEHLKNKVNNI